MIEKTFVRVVRDETGAMNLSTRVSMVGIEIQRATNGAGMLRKKFMEVGGTGLASVMGRPCES